MVKRTVFLILCISLVVSCSHQPAPEQAVVVGRAIPANHIDMERYLRPVKTASAVSYKPKPGRERIRLGSERLFDPEYFSLIRGKRIAIMANQTSRTTVDRLIGEERTTLAAVFAPEHGFTGAIGAGKAVSDTTYRGVPVYARYGGGDDTRRIPVELLAGIDVLLFEIQDIGTRHYTYISSMYLAMDSAADANVTFVVLDRPVGVNGENVEGPVLDAAFQTFVGVGRLPNRYGMTIGELAVLFRNEPEIMDGPRYPRMTESDPYFNVRDLKLAVVPMSGYDRKRCYDEQAGIPAWVATSPNIPSVNAALCYVGAGLFDGNTIGEMVSGFEQFAYISFPFIRDRAELDDFLAAAAGIYDFPGVTLEPVTNPKTGIANVVHFRVRDRRLFNPSYAALALLYAQVVKYPEVSFFTSEEGAVFFRKIHGNEWFAAALADPRALPPFREIIARVGDEEKKFREIRQKYLLY